MLAIYRSITSTRVEAESRGERYYICVIGQISLVYEGVRRGRVRKGEISYRWPENGESEREVWGRLSLLCPF